MTRTEQFLFAKIVVCLLTKILAIVTFGAYSEPILDEFADTTSEAEMVKKLFAGEKENG